MKRIKYGWHAGCKYGPKDAQIIGRELVALKKNHAEGLTNKVVLDAARPKNAPMHGYFTWDDRAAAESYRLQQAHYLLSNLKVVYLNEDTGKEYDVRAFWNVRRAEDEGEGEIGRTFVPIVEVMTDSELRKAAIARFLAEIASLRDRYAIYQELADVFKAIDLSIQRIQSSQKKEQRAESAAA